MSEFKVGDKVTIRSGGWGISTNDLKALGVEVGVTIFTIRSIVDGDWAALVELPLFESRTISFSGLDLVDSVELKRQALKSALELVNKYLIGVGANPTNPKYSIYSAHANVANGGANLYEGDLCHLLDTLFPKETPAQKELKQLEDQQRELADKISEVRKKL